jgi:sulfate adenylyltransferase subunit 1 (EFTu-like GTPase family)
VSTRWTSSEERYDEVVEDFSEFARRLDIHDLRFVPVSALEGDNIVDPSQNMPWYHGPTVLELLEDIHIGSDPNLIDVRVPVQYVIRPHRHDFPDYRGYAGKVAGGLMKPGDEVIVLPSGFSSRIKTISTSDGDLDEAAPPRSVVITLDDDIDISRGDMICRPHNQPHSSQDIDAMISWMSEGSPLREGAKYSIKHTTRWGKAMVRDLQYRLDVNSLHRDDTAKELGLNEIGRIRLRTTTPFFFDEYRRNRETGSFVLVDEGSNNTVGAGMITGQSA